MILSDLRKLKPVTLVTTGRTGSDFLQSLLDSHPQILTFNGSLDFYSFWDKSICVKSGNFDISDLVDEFIGHHIEKFKSRYDITENKNNLGHEGNESIDINISSFKQNFLNIVSKYDMTSSNFLLGIYGAYALSLNQDLSKKKVFFHHIHHHSRLERYFEDFPNSKIISMTRDPRANIVSGYLHHSAYNPQSMGGSHQYFYIRRILEDSSGLKKITQNYISVRIEDLGNESLLKSLSKWMGIDYDEVLKQSTWGGMIWNGDRLSKKTNTKGKFSKEILNNKWEYLTKKDQYIFNFLMNDRLKYYGYKFKKKSIISYIIVPILVFSPLRYERKMLSISYNLSLIKRKKIQGYFFKSYVLREKNYSIFKILF